MENKKCDLKIQTEIIRVLKMVYDPEIPVNVYDLGLIYRIDIDDDNNVEMDITLTSPNCPVADNIVQEIKDKVSTLAGVKNVTINIVFEPIWDFTMVSEEAKLEMGLL